MEGSTAPLPAKPDSGRRRQAGPVPALATPDLLTASELALRVRVSVYQVWRWRREVPGWLPHVVSQMNGKCKYLFSEESVKAIYRRNLRPGNKVSEKAYKRIVGDGDRSQG